MRLITTGHLKSWAASVSAESRLPYFVKMLISAAIQPDKLRMPSDDAVWVPGFDAVVVNAEENRFVPTGMSGWELTKREDFRGAANENYDKRSKDKIEDGKEKQVVRKLNRSEITFVLVTPLVWKDKESSDHLFAQTERFDVRTACQELLCALTDLPESANTRIRLIPVRNKTRVHCEPTGEHHFLHVTKSHTMPSDARAALSESPRSRDTRMPMLQSADRCLGTGIITMGIRAF